MGPGAGRFRNEALHADGRVGAGVSKHVVVVVGEHGIQSGGGIGVGGRWAESALQDSREALEIQRVPRSNRGS